MTDYSAVIRDAYRRLPLDTLYGLLLKTPTMISTDGEADLEVTRGQKELYLLTGAHYSKKALQKLHEEIRPLVEKDPETWMFLVEGDSDRVDVPEGVYAHMLGEKYEVPMADPIIDPLRKEVIDEAVKSGIKRDDIYLTCLISMRKAIPKGVNVVTVMAERWGVSPEYLGQQCGYLIAEAITNPAGFAEKESQFRGVWNSLIDISNELSRKKIEGIMARHPDKTRILACVGALHKEIFTDMIYGHTA